MGIKNSVRQKTVVMEYENERPFSVGDEVILLERSNDNTGNVVFQVMKHEGRGVKGIGEDSSEKYHGWRGSEHRQSLFAHGVRIVTKIGEPYERSVKSYSHKQKVYKVTVGDDIHPEWA